MSCGLAALAPEDSKTVDELLKEADEALYAAKQGGKNTVALYGGPPPTAAEDDGRHEPRAEPGPGSTKRAHGDGAAAAAPSG